VPKSLLSLRHRSNSPRTPRRVMGALVPVVATASVEEQHLVDQAKLLSLAESTSLPPRALSLAASSPLLNPLLNRTKLKKKTKSKPSKTKAAVEQVKAKEPELVSADGELDDEGVLDLADQLSAQLDERVAPESEGPPVEAGGSSARGPAVDGDGEKRVSRQVARKVRCIRRLCLDMLLMH
jgi:hypothetical protein